MISVQASEAQAGPIMEKFEFARKELSLIFEEEPVSDGKCFRLFIGGDAVAENQTLLIQNNITSVLNCTIGFPNCFESILYHRVPILDVKGTDILAHLPDAMNFISKSRTEKRSILIHCMWGMSRAPSIALAYLIKAERINLSEALKRLVLARSSVRPNPSFVRQLLIWEQRHICQANGSVDLEQYKAAYQLNRTLAKSCSEGKSASVLYPQQEI